MMDGMECITVNIPLFQEEYERGLGEAVPVLVTKAVTDAITRGESGTVYTGILDKNSKYYKNLIKGDYIQLETCGKYRPVVPYEWAEING